MKITILSDSPFLQTGYSNQAKLLCRYLRSKGHEIHFLANSYVGKTVDYAKLDDGTIFDYKIYGEMMHSYFMNSIEEHLKIVRPDIFFILLDTFMLYPALLTKDLSPAKTIFWFPTDGGGGMPRGCEQILKKVDLPVAMSQFGQKQVKDYYNINTLHIPHGTEPDKFFRLSEQERTVLRQRVGLNDKFVIGVVARNQPRKMLDRTFKTMYYIKDKIPNAILFLHMDPRDASASFDMYSIIQKYNLENRVIFSGMKAHDGFGWNQMNEVYNLMDCMFLSTSGEGFGIPIIEAMACEVPVICTDYTKTPELIINNNAGLGINLSGVETIDMFKENSKDYDFKVFNGTLLGSWEVERGLMDIKDAANKIEYLSKNPDKCKEMGKNGRKAIEIYYDFDKHIGPAFEKLMEGK